MSQLQRQNGMSQLHDFKDRCATHTARQIHAQTDGPFDPWIHVDSFDLMVVIPTTFMSLHKESENAKSTIEHKKKQKLSKCRTLERRNKKETNLTQTVFPTTLPLKHLTNLTTYN